MVFGFGVDTKMLSCIVPVSKRCEADRKLEVRSMTLSSTSTFAQLPDLDKMQMGWHQKLVVLIGLIILVATNVIWAQLKGSSWPPCLYCSSQRITRWIQGKQGYM
jgi:hypothetical protein